MRVEVCRPGELSGADVQRWRAWQGLEPRLDSPFLSPEFTIAVGACRADARVAVVSDVDTVRAYLPFNLVRPGVAGPIGVNVGELQTVISDPGYDYDPCELVRRCGLRTWRFDHLLCGSPKLDAWTGWQDPSPVIDLSEGWAAYHESRRRHEAVRGSERKLRKLVREQGPVQFEWSSKRPADLAAMIRWKSDQYLRTGRRNWFAFAWKRELVERLAATDAPGCSGVLSVLSVGERPVALNFNLSSSTRLCHWMPTYDVEFAAYSVGMTMTLSVAEAAAERRIGFIDLGRGGQPYKRAVASWSFPVGAGSVPSTRAAALARSAGWKVIRRVKLLEVHHPATFGRLPRRVADLANR
jgi:CelD/BcsL family acetyltransferase involved in cellulose biosynthesis